TLKGTVAGLHPTSGPAVISVPSGQSPPYLFDCSFWKSVDPAATGAYSDCVNQSSNHSPNIKDGSPPHGLMNGRYVIDRLTEKYSRYLSFKGGHMVTANLIGSQKIDGQSNERPSDYQVSSVICDR